VVFRQPAYLRVGVQERIPELLVPWPTLQLTQGDREVVQVESPAAIVEVDGLCLTTMKEDVLVVEIAVDETEGAGLSARVRVDAQTTSSALANSAASSVETSDSTS
jgi:hypothetical protein